MPSRSRGRCSRNSYFDAREQIRNQREKQRLVFIYKFGKIHVPEDELDYLGLIIAYFQQMKDSPELDMASPRIPRSAHANNRKSLLITLKASES